MQTQSEVRLRQEESVAGRNYGAAVVMVTVMSERALLSCCRGLASWKPTCKPGSEPWSEASVVVLPHGFGALVRTALVLVAFAALEANVNIVRKAAIKLERDRKTAPALTPRRTVPTRRLGTYLRRRAEAA